jgi:hypothetical protein
MIYAFLHILPYCSSFRNLRPLVSGFPAWHPTNLTGKISSQRTSPPTSLNPTHVISLGEGSSPSLTLIIRDDYANFIQCIRERKNVSVRAA